jgi:hypothetical protein
MIRPFPNQHISTTHICASFNVGPTKCAQTNLLSPLSKRYAPAQNQEKGASITDVVNVHLQSVGRSIVARGRVVMSIVLVCWMAMTGLRENTSI